MTWDGFTSMSGFFGKVEKNKHGKYLTVCMLFV
jgi:hypothetical protein